MPKRGGFTSVLEEACAIHAPYIQRLIDELKSTNFVLIDDADHE